MTGNIELQFEAISDIVRAEKRLREMWHLEIETFDVALHRILLWDHQKRA